MNPFLYARKRVGLSVRKFAKAVGVSPQTIVNWEVHHQWPSDRATLLSVARISGLTIDQLAGSTPIPADAATVA